MPDETPDYRDTLLALIDRCVQHLGELNVLTAYVPDLSNRSTHLTSVQGALAALAALRADVEAIDES